MIDQGLERKITIPSILKFALPSMVMMVVMSLYTVVDGMFVSRLVGTDAFSAVNIVYPLLSFVIALGTMFGTGITAIVSRKLGEGKQQEANEKVTFITLFAVGLGIVITILSFVFLEKIIYMLGANEDIYAYCYAYAFPLLIFQPANILQLEFQSLFVANGKPHIGLTVTVAGGLANVVLDYVFIGVFHMGIAGAAVATGIGYCIPAFFSIFYFTFNRKAQLHFVKPKMDWRVLLNSMTNGSSEMVSNLSGSITTFLFNIIMMRLVGNEGVAAISILLYLDFVLIAISLGYSMGVAPLFSYNYGGGHVRKLRKLYKISVGFCMGVGVVMTVGTLLFSGTLASVFAERGSRVYELATAGLMVYAFGYLFKGYNIFSSAMFTAFGDGKVSAILSFMRTLVFLVAFLIGFSVLFGVNGVWSASLAAEFMAFALAVFYTFKKKSAYHYLP